MKMNLLASVGQIEVMDDARQFVSLPSNAALCPSL